MKTYFPTILGLSIALVLTACSNGADSAKTVQTQPSQDNSNQTKLIIPNYYLLTGPEYASAGVGFGGVVLRIKEGCIYATSNNPQHSKKTFLIFPNDWYTSAENGTAIQYDNQIFRDGDVIESGGIYLEKIENYDFITPIPEHCLKQADDFFEIGEGMSIYKHWKEKQ